MTRSMCRSLLIFVLAVCPMGAQEFRATLTGRVVDQSQAVMPDVKIAAVETQTGARFATVSGQDGQYTLPFLQPGTYRLSAEAVGMKHYIREGLTISAAERKAVDIALEVGQMTENVTITADAPLLETASGALGQAVTAEQVANIPLNGRTPLMLAQLWAGILPNGGPSLNRPFDLSHTSDFSIGGTPSATNELLLDGAPNTFRGGSSAYSPPMDSVMEVKVEAFQSDAAYGSTGGGTVNVVSKSGTNRFRGSVYEFNQVGKLAANTFFLNRTGQPKSFSLWNQFGATLGGPVTVPKVFDGKDKLLFFFSYEGIRQPNPLGFTGTVPTDALRKGDLSQLLALGSSYQVYDPFSAVRQGTRVQRQPLAGNLIPQRLLNPIAQKYLQFFPSPNAAGGADGRNNYVTNADQVDNFNNYLGRLDYNANSRHKIFLGTRHSARSSFEKAWYHNMSRGRYKLRDSWGVMLDDVYTLTPTTVLNVRLNWTRYAEVHQLQSTGIDLVGMGFAPYLAANSPLVILPRVDIGVFGQLGESNANTTPFDSWQIFTNLVKVVNRHNVKFGADLRRSRESNYQPSNSSGRFQFSTNWTRGPLDSSPAAPVGQDMAAFLMGLPTGGQYDLSAFRTNVAGYVAFFVQDDIRLRNNLTVNLGLRYEKERPTTERYDRMVGGFDPAAVNSVTAAAKAAYAKSPIPEVPVAAFNPLGGLLFPGPGHRSPYSTGSTDFSPRLGFAWTPALLGGRTVIRGGGGVFFFNLGITALDQTGFSQSTSLVPTQDGYLTPYGTLNDPFPGGIQQPLGAALGVNTYLGRGISYFNSSPSTPYTVRWNLNIQRQLAQNLVAEVGYLYNHSVHLGVDRSTNFTPGQYLSTTGQRDQATIDFLSAQVTNPFSGLIPGTNLSSSVVARSQLLKARPQFTDVTALAGSEGSSYSHMLMARMDKRFAGGLQVQANFQYSRLMQKLDRLNDSDPGLQKRVASIDRPLRFVASGLYALPVGRGKRVLGDARGIVNQMFGGWQVSGVFVSQQGAPLEWGDVIYLGGDLQMNPTNIDRAFDTTRFNTNSRQQLGSDIRTFPTSFSNLRSAGVVSLDVAAIKDFPIRERLKLQYRCEFFNAPNHPLFGVPDVSPTSTTFGQVKDLTNLPRRIQMALRLNW